MSAHQATRRPRRGDPDLRRHAHGALSPSELEAIQPAELVDALGTFCPEPVIRTQDRMAIMASEEVLELLADDAGVEIDIPAWCISTGNLFLGVLKEASLYRVFVRKA